MRQLRPSLARGFTLVELMIVVAIVGVLASLGTYGVRKYVANAKTAEARNAVGQIAQDAQAAYEKASANAATMFSAKTRVIGRSLCTSSTASVPASITSVKGTKYQSSQAATADWNLDATNPGAGFACLKFSMSAPQYFLYSYAGAVTTSFTATANGDLNGDGHTSSFLLWGSVNAATGGSLYVSPTLTVTDGED